MDMNHDSKYSISKSFLYPVCMGVFLVAAGIMVLYVRSPQNSGVALGVASLWISLGLIVIISNLAALCWYPVLLGKHIVLEHCVFPYRTRTIPYEDMLYARVDKSRVGQYGHAAVLTVFMKNGKKKRFILMIRLEHIGQLSQELIEKGVPDTKTEE